MSSQNCRNLGVSNFQDLTGTLGRGGKNPKWTKEISCLLAESMSLLSEKNGKKSAWRWTEQKMEKTIPVIWFAENCKKGMYMILQH